MNKYIELNKLYNHFIHIIIECVNIDNLNILSDYINIFNKKYNKKYIIFTNQPINKSKRIIRFNMILFKKSNLTLYHSSIFSIEDKNNFYNINSMNYLTKETIKQKSVSKKEININSKNFKIIINK
jgi:hypothetical protein